MQIVIRDTIELAGDIRANRGHNTLDRRARRLFIGTSHTASANSEVKGHEGTFFHDFGFR